MKATPTNIKQDRAGMDVLCFCLILPAVVAICWGQREDMTLEIYLHNM